METSISDLPIEILFKIFSYLKAEDVVSFSAVCKSWRNLLNDNKLWEKLCMDSFSVNDLFPKLMDRPQAVKPCLPVPVNISEDLSDVCEWRLKYMELSRFTRNLKQGNYESCFIPGEFNIVNDENDGNFTVAYNSNIITIINVAAYPCVIESFPLLLAGTPNFIKFCKDKLIVCQEALVQIYTLNFNLNKFHLIKAFLLINLEEGLKTPYLENINEWYQIEIKNRGYNEILEMRLLLDHNGIYFVAFDKKRFTFSIWDMNLNIKIWQQLIPEHDGTFLCGIYLHFGNMYLESRKLESPAKLFCFNFSSMSFTDFSITFDSYYYDHLLFFEKFVIIGSDHKLLLWDRATGVFLYEICCTFPLFQIKMVPYTPFLILGGNGGIQVFNTEKPETMSVTLNREIIIVNIQLLSKDLALLTYFNKGVRVWDLCNNRELYDIKDQTRCLWTSASRSEAVMYKAFNDNIEHFVIYFW